MNLFLIGGFLGSGKTTAIYQAVNYLLQHGKIVNVITNDQGKQQVDTNYLRFYHISTEEVSGGCFCCNLPDLANNIKNLLETRKPDAIFAESVGSCTDLVATVINPLLNVYGSQLKITLSIFADIKILLTYLHGNKSVFHNNVNYIYEKQLEEADIIVINKIDLLTQEQLQKAKHFIKEQLGYRKILYQSSLNITNIRYWVKTISNFNQDPKLRTSPDINYDKYAAGEAEMAWLDEEVGILTDGQNAPDTGTLFTKKIYEKINHQGYAIGHLKFLLNDGKQQQKISYTSVSQPYIKKKSRSVKTNRVVILINARVQTDPILLRQIIVDTICELELLTGCKIVENNISFFKPGYPKPTQRIPLHL